MAKYRIWSDDLRDIGGFLWSWGINVAIWAASIFSVSYFLGCSAEVEAFFRSNRTFMFGVMLSHIAIYAILYHANRPRRRAADAVERLGK